MYHAAHLVERNVDAVFSDALHLLQTSDLPFVKRLFSSGDGDDEHGGAVE